MGNLESNHLFARWLAASTHCLVQCLPARDDGAGGVRLPLPVMPASMCRAAAVHARTTYPSGRAATCAPTLPSGRRLIRRLAASGLGKKIPL